MPWTNITNAQLAVGAPIRSVDLLALRDNILALGNQEAGAPTLVKSLNGQTGVITNTNANSIGSYYFQNTPLNIAPFGTTAGSNLDYYNESTNAVESAGLSGTWRWMGSWAYGTVSSRTQMYVRIS